MALPANVGFCFVHGRFIRAILDGNDSDRDPDGVPITNLTLTFRADLERPVVRNLTATPPVVIAVDPIVVKTNTDGDLVGSDDAGGIYLVASNDADLDPHGWTYTVSIVGPTFPKQTVTFVAPEGGDVDLATVIEVPASPGSALLAWQAAVAQTQANVATAEAARAAAVAAAASISKGTPNGVAGLDGGGRVPDAQLPTRLSEEEIAASIGALNSGRSFDIVSFGAKVDGESDDTAALQAAIDASVAAGGGRVWSSKLGVCLLSGPQQTGTGLNGYEYSGQILIPAVPYATPLSLILDGTLPFPVLLNPNNPETQSKTGLIFKSTASSGSVVDAIPGQTVAATAPFTNFVLTLRDFTLRLPLNPQANGIKGTAIARLRSEGACCIDVDGPGNGLTFPTGTAVGLKMPATHNQALNHLTGDFAVVGFPYGVEATEHALFDNLNIQYCATALWPNSGANHGIRFNRVLVQRCVTVIGPGPGGVTPNGRLDGLIDIETASVNVYEAPWAFKWLVDDTTSQLQGRIHVLMSQYNSPLGLPVRNAANLNIADVQRGSQGWMETTPFDEFKRLVPVTAQNGLGNCSQSMHPWTSPGSGFTFTIDASGMGAASTAGGYACARYVNRVSPGGSRTTIMKLTTGSGSYRVGAIFNLVSLTQHLYLQLEGGTATLRKRVANVATVLATSAAGVVAASTAYTMVVTYSKPIGAAWVMTVYLNGLQVLSHTFSTQDMTDMAEASIGAGGYLVRDGVLFGNDVLSRVSEFRSLPGIS